jgi:hypothetical protein
MIYKWYPPQLNSRLGVINPGLTLASLESCSIQLSISQQQGTNCPPRGQRIAGNRSRCKPARVPRYLRSRTSAAPWRGDGVTEWLAVYLCWDLKLRCSPNLLSLVMSCVLRYIFNDFQPLLGSSTVQVAPRAWPQRLQRMWSAFQTLSPRDSSLRSSKKAVDSAHQNWELRTNIYEKHRGQSLTTNWFWMVLGLGQISDPQLSWTCTELQRDSRHSFARVFQPTLYGVYG